MVAVERRGLRRLQIGAAVLQLIEAERRDAAVGLHGRLDPRHPVGRGVGRQQVLQPVLDPLDRACGLPRRERHGDDVREDRLLDAEAAARIGHGPQPEPGPRHLERPRHDRMQRHRPLEVGEHVVDAFAGVVVGDQAEALDGRARVARVAHRGRDRVRGIGERRLRLAVAERALADEVAAHGLVQHRRVRAERRLGVDDGVERLVAHVDQGERVLRPVAVLGHDDGDRLAGVAHPVGGDAPVLHGLADGHDEGRGPGPRVLARDHGVDARHRLRRRRIDAEQAGVRVGRAQDGGVARAGRHRQVVDVAAAAHEEGRVLDALQRRAERVHGSLARACAAIEHGRSNAPSDHTRSR